MNRTALLDPYFPTCPIRNVLSRVTDKWSLLVLFALSNSESGIIRFKELQRQIPDISQKMLTVTLRSLEDDGFVVRKVYPEVPPKVEYSLTERAYSLIPYINSLLQWSMDNRDAILNDRMRYNKQKGKVA